MSEMATDPRRRRRAHRRATSSFATSSATATAHSSRRTETRRRAAPEKSSSTSSCSMSCFPARTGSRSAAPSARAPTLPVILLTARGEEVGSDRRSRARRGRLRHQAVLAPGARGPRPRGAPPVATHERRASGSPSGHRARRGRARCERPARALASDGTRSSTCSGSSPAIPRGLLARPADGERLGLRAGARHAAPSPFTSGACGRSSRTTRRGPRHLQTVWGVGYRLTP